MKTVFIALQLALALLVGPIQAADDPRMIAGYGKTIWGMSEDEVLIAESPRAEKLDKPLSNKIGITSVGIKEIQIGGDKFTVRFTFDHKSQKLIRVSLTGLNLENQLINLRIFDSIEKLLTEKYGAPTHKHERKTKLTSERSTSWKLPKTVIELRYQDLASSLTFVEVVYEPAESSTDASKNL